MGNTKISNIIYPEEFKTNFIYVYLEYEDELKRIIEQSGRKDEFIRKYRKTLLFLNNLKTNCIKQRKLFEKLKDCKDLYSIKPDWTPYFGQYLPITTNISVFEICF